MKTIGLLGGMSAASTQTYYRRLCDLTREAMGGLHSPDLIIRSLDFAPIAAAQAAGDWEALAQRLNAEARLLEQAGAQVIVLATNTMHKLAAQMMQGVSVPLIHIAEATAQAIASAGLHRPGLMATAFTMEQGFYTDALRAAGLAPVLPAAPDRADIHRIIYDELCKDVVTPPSRLLFEEIARRLEQAGADSLVLGCTEVGMLLNAQNVPVPVFDTVEIHCQAAIRTALGT
ncbi:aspartate/glutamate racemase family protein [Fuscibacter oryzae]|uniref:Aspartate/glutamate racemase family protein n=1 Tax=Fuscibacter oryzae TaxID=2803939 RepID=A0A8J7MN96_9RHOB|nr:aspartate/glutamate racemase family protein [Fuscibacter oryzae]MBL4926906.1 aspartate/glutamate racemase family protein [Fuscibacter oryzae]